MSDFTGLFEAAMDEKGRFAMPFRFRRLLRPEDEDTFMVTPGFDGGLMAFPKATWTVLREDIGRINPFNKGQRKFLRRFSHESEECRLDGQGRIMIPSHLRDKCGINGKAIVAGSLDWIEIFDPTAYKAIRERDDDEAAEIANGIELPPRPRPTA